MNFIIFPRVCKSSRFRLTVGSRSTDSGSVSENFFSFATNRFIWPKTPDITMHFLDWTRELHYRMTSMWRNPDWVGDIYKKKNSAFRFFSYLKITFDYFSRFLELLGKILSECAFHACKRDNFDDKSFSLPRIA